MKSAADTLDQLARHVGEVKRQHVAGTVDAEAIANAERWIKDAGEAADELEQQLNRLRTGIDRAQAEMEPHRLRKAA